MPSRITDRPEAVTAPALAHEEERNAEPLLLRDPRTGGRSAIQESQAVADSMYTPLTWGGVDWFGCDDDLTWEPLTGLHTDAADTGRSSSTRRSPAARTTTDAAHGAPRPAGVSRRRGRRRTAPPARRVLILDVENMCPGSRRPVRALAHLRAVLTAAGPVDQVIAASAASQHERLDHLLRAAGVQVHTRVRNRPNAADRALIQAARSFARDGDCEVVIASNDHGFRAIAGLPGVRRIVLLTVPRLATARSLVRIADELRPVAA